MQGLEARRAHPELRELVREASRALSLLDAERLEELALCSRALNRDIEFRDDAGRVEMARQARESREDMAVFGRLLEATRANLAVMARIRALRRGRQLEYGERGTERGRGYGDD